MKKSEYQSMAVLEDTHWWFISKRLFVASILKDHLSKKNNRLLDVGCGTGGMTKFLQQWGKVEGVEKEKVALTFLHKNKIEAIAGDANNLPYKANEFDLVSFFDVLYHQNVDDKKALNEAFRVLKKNGLIVITDSALPWLWSTHDEIMQAKKRYTKQMMVKMITKQGFEVIRASYIFCFTLPLVVMVRLIQRLISNYQSNVAPVHSGINAILIFIMKVEAKLLQYVDLPVGSSLLILARKI